MSADEDFVAALKEMYDQSVESDGGLTVENGAFEHGFQFGMQIAAMLALGQRGKDWPGWLYE